MPSCLESPTNSFISFNSFRTLLPGPLHTPKLFITLLLPISWPSYRPTLPPTPCDPHQQVYSRCRTLIYHHEWQGLLSHCSQTGTLSPSISFNWTLLYHSKLSSKCTFLS
ncbi:hypothetical protein LDENG_00196650 [Lucifuga dentata]|nr:hypothetical protein LDENG_00196650 [Lucifuga dentata]